MFQSDGVWRQAGWSASVDNDGQFTFVAPSGWPVPESHVPPNIKVDFMVSANNRIRGPIVIREHYSMSR